MPRTGRCGGATRACAVPTVLRSRSARQRVHGGRNQSPATVRSVVAALIPLRTPPEGRAQADAVRIELYASPAANRRRTTGTAARAIQLAPRCGAA